MKIKIFTQPNCLIPEVMQKNFTDFVTKHPKSTFFQGLEFFHFLEGIPGFVPVCIIATGGAQEIMGSILGVIQTNGGGIKSWLSRRMIIYGGPLIRGKSQEEDQLIINRLLSALDTYASSRAIYIEFRNNYNTSYLQKTFEACGYQFRPHLNYLVKTDNEVAVRKRMSKSRLRQIKTSLKNGAKIVEAQNEEEIKTFYNILKDLYQTKVKKPLPEFDFFLKIGRSPQFKIFLVLYEEEIIGGIACPIFANRIIYEWYICGKTGVAKGVYPSVLATWAPIQYGLDNQYEFFDFMGAGSPDQPYGVREFKARFGGEEVNFGRYQKILNKTFYNVGKLGLKVYKSLSNAHPV